MNLPTSRALIGSASIVVIALLSAAQAAAQTASHVAAAPELVDDAPIIVTGSRIARSETSSPNPVMTITARDIEQSGLTNLTELLAQSPALFNSLTNADTAGAKAAFGATGVNLLDLRNLGTQRTLVLVNGRRHIAGVAGQAAVDINTIPVGLVERVDVLTGGVSAIYGADGVSGVVNFVLKRDFDGLDLRAQQGISTYGDGPNTFISAIAGKNFADGRGNIAVSYEFRRDGRVAYADRAIGRPDAEHPVRNPNDIPDDPNVFDKVFLSDLRFADTSPDGAVIVDFAFDDGGNLVLPPRFRGGGQPYQRGLILPGSGGLTQGGSSTSINAYQGDLQAESEVHNVNLLASFEFSPALRLFAEGKYVRSSAYSLAQPSYDFYTFVPADNAYLPQSIRDAIVPGNFSPFGLPDGVLVNRDNLDLGIRDERVERHLFRAVLGFDGRISDNASYEISYTFGHNKSRSIRANNRYRDRYLAAIDAVDEGRFLTGTPNGNIVCRSTLTGGTAQTFTPGANSACRPLNIFGEGVRSQAALDFINTTLVSRVTQTQHVASGHVAGDFGALFELPGGPVSFVFGGEYRRESSTFRPDPIAATADAFNATASVLADLALLAPESGSFDVWESFAELRAPLMADRPFAHRLEIGAALRLSDYSTSGSTTTWKIDGIWAPVRDIVVRGSFSEAVRAPNITELFAPTTGAFFRLADPCSPANINNGTQFRAANCEALLTALGVDFGNFDFDSSPLASGGLSGRQTGNAALREEKARTWTAGVAVQPRLIPGLSVTLDWYDIRLTDAINTATFQETANFCVDAPTLDNVFCQNITRDPATGYVADYLLTPQNVAFFETAGADLTVNYSFSPGLGRVNLRGSLGYLDKLLFLPANGGHVDNDRGEVGAPKWVGTADVTWDLGSFLVNYGFNYVGKQRRFEYDETENNPDLIDPEFLYYRAAVTHDIRFEWQVADEKFSFFGGANNFTNAQPDRGSATTPVGFMGRYFYAGARVRSDALGL